MRTVMCIRCKVDFHTESFFVKVCNSCTFLERNKPKVEETHLSDRAQERRNRRKMRRP